MSAVLWTIRALDIAAMVAVGVMLVLAWTHRHRAEGRLLIPMLVGTEAWVLGDLIAQSSSSASVVRWAVGLQLVASGGVVLFLLLFVLTYTGRRDVIQPSFVGLLLVEPVGFTLLLLTNPVHRLVFQNPLVPDSVVEVAGPVLFGHIAYSYALVAVALGLAGALIYRAEFVYRRQATALILGILAPFLGNVLYFFGPVSVDLTPIMFVVTGGLLTYAALRAELLDLSPVARSVVLETIGNGVLVLDRNAAVLDSNPQARQLLGTEERVLVGQPVTELLPDRSAPLERLVETIPPETESRFELEVGDRVLEVQVTPLRDARRQGVGAILVLHDITERVHQERELARERERLEQFASVVSHDLRNPLNVATGGVALLREDCDSEHLDLVAGAHDRMESILEETLMLARQGQSVGSMEWLSLAEVCEHCWEMVQVGDATLEVEDDVTIRGDRNRLRHLFENLFRNSVEHGSPSGRTGSGDLVERAGPDVTVRVGPLADGVYVEDDGPGIPVEKREDVFELGHSITDGGSGLGLAIVDEIVDAHGWEVAITDGRDGGARFEITGVEFADG